MGVYGLKAARLHLEYIQREGVGAEGEPGALYGRDGAVNAPDFGQELPGEPRQFRFIIGPEDGKDLDLTSFTQRLMAQVEIDLGRRLRWVASNHHDTDNPHVHLVVRGLDESGAEVRIDPEYIKQGFRNRAREIATEELGLRSDYDLDRQLDREVQQQRFTTLDRELARRAKDLKLDLSAIHHERYLAPRLVSRLRTLEGLGLARATGGPHWNLLDGWETTLRQLGTQNDIIKRLHERVPMEPSRYRTFPDSDRLQPQGIEGIIRAKGLHDEQRGSFFFAVEALDGYVYYVSMPAHVAADRRIGDLVRVEMKQGVGSAPSPARPAVRLLGSQSIEEQVRYRGPTWLDTMPADADVGTIGFAAKVFEARRRRDRFLSEAMGLDPTAPETRTRLRSFERAHFGAELALSGAGRYLAAAPGTLRGRLERVIQPLPSGQFVTLIRNDASNEFVVLNRAAEHRALDGQQVELTRGHQGKIAVRPVILGPGR